MQSIKEQGWQAHLIKQAYQENQRKQQWVLI
jgi:hypothetical protein